MDAYVQYKREQETIKETIENTVREMLKNGLDIDMISKVTKLSNEEIKSIGKTLEIE